MEKIELNTNQTVNKNSFLSNSHSSDIKFQSSLTQSMAELIKTLIKSDTTSREIKMQSSSKRAPKVLSFFNKIEIVFKMTISFRNDFNDNIV